MRKLKTFEKFATANEELSDIDKNYKLSQSDLESIYDGTAGNIEIPGHNINDFAMEIAYFKDKEHLTAWEVQNVYDFAFSQDYETCIKIASYFVHAHPYIKRDYVGIWQDFVKKWHKKYEADMIGPNRDNFIKIADTLHKNIDSDSRYNDHKKLS